MRELNIKMVLSKQSMKMNSYCKNIKELTSRPDEGIVGFALILIKLSVEATEYAKE